MEEATLEILQERLARISPEVLEHIQYAMIIHSGPYCAYCFYSYAFFVGLLIDDVSKLRTFSFLSNSFHHYESLIDKWENECKSYGLELTRQHFSHEIRIVFENTLLSLNSMLPELGNDLLDKIFDEVLLQLIHCGGYYSSRNYYWHNVYDSDLSDLVTDSLHAFQ